MSEQRRPFGFEKTIVKMVFEKSNGRCWYCGRAITIESRAMYGGSTRDAPLEYFKSTYVVDHLLPRKRGGTDDFENLVPACWSCNGMKRSYTVEEFREVMTRLANNAPKFTEEQLYYLNTNGLELPSYEPHVFYFEKEGLRP